MEMTLKLTDDSEKRLWRGYEYFYFFVFSCVLIDTYYNITMFRNVLWVIPFVSIAATLNDFFLPTLLGLNGLFILLSLFKKCPASFSYTPQQAIVAFICGGALLMPHFLYGYAEPLWFAALLIGAHNIDCKKLIRYYFWGSVVICSLTFLCGITGHIENLIYYRGDGTMRIAFGFNYPTDFCSHIFFLVVCWLWLKEEKTTFLEIGGIAVLAAFAYLACNARTTAATLLLLAVWMLIVKWRAHKNNGKYRMTKPLQMCCFFAPLAGTGFMTAASLLYSESNPFFALVDKLISTRLSLGHEGFRRYNFTPFGQPVMMNGNGGTTIAPRDYFFLDCSYVNILLRYGVVTLIFVLCILFYLTLNEKRKGAFVRVGLLGIVALQCVIEQHLMEIGHSPLLLLLLACDDERQNGFDFLRFIKKSPHSPETT